MDSSEDKATAMTLGDVRIRTLISDARFGPRYEDVEWNDEDRELAAAVAKMKGIEESLARLRATGESIASVEKSDTLGIVKDVCNAICSSMAQS